MPGELSGPANNPHSSMSRRITSTAVAAALILPWFIPTLPGIIKTGNGNGTGPGGTISINQSIDLRKSLTSTTPVPLMSYTSTSKEVRSDYLQMSVLDTFDGNSWTSGSVPQNPLDANTNVAIPGLTTLGVKRNTITTHVKIIANFMFNAVPVPYAPQSITGIVQPLYDPATLEVVPGDSATRSRNGNEYTVTSAEILPTAEQVQAATGADPTLNRYTKLPANFPADVRAKAAQITANATTPWAKAVALQSYFLSDFTYSLQVQIGRAHV